MVATMKSPISEVQTESRAAAKPQRTRVLRTYSKRTLSSDSAQPTPKRGHIEKVNTAVLSNDEISTKLPCDTTIPPSPTLPPAQPARKGTIMNYFKVVPSSPSCTPHSPEPSSEPADPTCTPPSSPPVSNLQQKKRRRLTTRIVSRATSVESKMNYMVDEDEKERGNEVDVGSTLPSNPSPTLSEISSATLNLPVVKPKRQPDTKRERSMKKTSKVTTVQTTLSLSIEDKGFTECKECDMLYNPLHREDAKYHAKRHAAILKAKLSSSNNT
ncbi:uncharacterized protein F4812DRAFT_143560 [Daldinia caldariorum]|uniref:uncharacterized protein n=1 Tax=Daldinia caldariorum TaxID=326644 RepID=UPI002007734F|nr:uncharacterized protein F4812DRAFT_143560 [Daldinia caldariorum]KAI1464882.1 hypothetical protein F4812DRAFT_143560 [Daldinia caldariorum]